MANNINLLEKYIGDAVIKTYAAESKTRLLEQRDRIKMDGAGTLYVATLDVAGFSNYKRARGANPAAGYSEFAAGESTGSGYDVGGVGLRWERFDPQWERGIQLRIDALDDEETNSLVIGNVVNETLRRVAIPETDALRFGALVNATGALLGNQVNATIADNAIMAAINAGFDYLAEQEVPDTDQVLFVNPKIMSKIRNTTELAHKLTQEDYRSTVEGITFTVRKYEGRLIEEVPSSRFFTDVLAGRGGYYPQATSKVINFLIVNLDAALPVVKVKDFRIFTPDQVQDFYGYKVNFLLEHGIFIPKDLATGIYAHVSLADPSPNKSRLNVALDKGATGKSKVTDFAVLPISVGKEGDLYGITSANGPFVLGTAISDYTTPTAITVDTEFTALASNKGYFALVRNGVVVAASAEYKDIPKGA